MTDPARPTPASAYVVFDGDRLIARGTAADAALACRAAGEGRVLAFGPDGRQEDFDLRGSEAEVRDRYAPPPQEPRGRGRPRLGVVAREVTLLPRHWDWLAAQPGGASTALRRLVEDARKADDAPARRRAGQDAAYRFLSAMAGNLPGFEEAIRALYGGDRGRLERLAAAWPADIRDHALSMLDV